MEKLNEGVLPVKRGEKTIKLMITLFTDGFTVDPAKVLPKQAWDYGYVSLRANETHGLRSGDRGIDFANIDEIGGAVRRVLTSAGVKLKSNPTRHKRADEKAEQFVEE